MRLQCLEVAGFKSFPDRAELTFDKGVTAIVGPNGCGKSNLVDALTWVLGEQSAKSLRGDRMEDVIFGGSDARKPTGAAEVRLKLAGVAARVPSGVAIRTRGNGHGAMNGGGAAVMTDVAVEEETPLIVRDVELMRRLYRSGESEYLIDGAICRLRDVQDLLMDSGVGVKAYAVIEQGKIGQILSARPTDRRQLIEEAAGVTKYKSRRRAAELKLEAAQQNLTRVDDIIFEVEKQRAALKRQAGKARRYRRLRDELRRWEKVQFAVKYRVLRQAIDSAHARLSEAREREALAAAALAEQETTLERLRLELTQADADTTAAREAAHASELEMGRLQQQIAFDRQQVEQIEAAATGIEVEVHALEERRDPAHRELAAKRDAALRAASERDEAARSLVAEEEKYAAAQREIEGLEGDVEAARSEVFAAVNAATALRHAMEHAGAAMTRMAEQIARLDVEAADLRLEGDRAVAARVSAEESLSRARESIDAVRCERAARESELAGARAEIAARRGDLNALEHEHAALKARLRSLEEMDAARVEYADGARLLLSECGTTLAHMGSVADYLEVDVRYERAAEAALGDLLQHVVVPTHDQVVEGLRLASQRDAGRVGFLVAESAPVPHTRSVGFPSDLSSLRPLAELIRVSGPAADAIVHQISDLWIAEDFDSARTAAASTGASVITLDGDVFHGPYVVQAGARAEARGILTTKREIKELRGRCDGQRSALDGAAEAIVSIDVTAAAAQSAIDTLQEEAHRLEKAVIGFELQRAAARDAAERVDRKQQQIASERRAADEELRAQEARQDEARASILRIESEQRDADLLLNLAQRRLFDLREQLQAQLRRTADAKAGHAALVERANAVVAEVDRLEESMRDLETRVAARYDDRRRTATRRGELIDGIAASEARLDAGLRMFDELKARVHTADDHSQSLRADFVSQENRIRDARRALESIRAEAAQFDITRATAEADLSHLSASCVETVQAALDTVAAEVDELERAGALASPRPVDDTPDSSETDEEMGATDVDRAASQLERVPAPATGSLTADDMVADLRAKIERMGAVNMMAIDQFDDLESRHGFLTVQRKDLVDSISATGEAIRRIDKTTRERFREAFTAINQYFESTFSTLFGGGRAGLVLLDESDQLESGIDIIAQPPGKRLQNVQLLSGGEKALTAMALMFAIFRYRPSPFCLLDEIDAPLDDANIGRFVEMLQGMQDQTQFILITHNRKTMEIADRLYGVTMEEPGVSKLISVQLN